MKKTLIASVALAAAGFAGFGLSVADPVATPDKGTDTTAHAKADNGKKADKKAPADNDKAATNAAPTTATGSL